MRSTIALHSSGLGPWQWKQLQGEVIAPQFVRDTAEEDIADVVAILKAQKMTAHLVGHSYGGFIALKAALQVPDKVRTIFAYEPVAYGVLRTPAERADLESLKASPWFADQASGGNAQWLEKFVNYWSGEGAWEEMSDNVQQSFLSQGRRVFGEVMSLDKDNTPIESYAQTLRMPAVIMSGTESPLPARKVAERIGQGLRQGHHMTVKGAGHMAPLTHFREVNAAIMAISRA